MANNRLQSPSSRAWMRIDGATLYISRCNWIYPNATKEAAGLRDEHRYNAIGRRDGDIVFTCSLPAALRQVLNALCGPGHHIRELQATMNGPFDSPITKLIDQFNAWALNPEADANKQAAPVDAAPVFVLPITVAKIIDAAFLPSNPSKLRTAHEDTKAAAKIFKECLVVAMQKSAALAASKQGGNHGE